MGDSDSSSCSLSISLLDFENEIEVATKKKGKNVKKDESRGTDESLSTTIKPRNKTAAKKQPAPKRQRGNKAPTKAQQKATEKESRVAGTATAVIAPVVAVAVTVTAETDKVVQDKQVELEDFESGDDNPQQQQPQVGNNGKVTSIITNLGSELQERVKSKRQRLEICFQSVKMAPKTMLETLDVQTEERSKMVESFKEKSKAVMNQVEAVLQLQTATEEKLSKMMSATQRHFDVIKDALNTTVAGLTEAVEQFVGETEKLEDKHGQESKKQLQTIQLELCELQKKILLDGQQEETESIRSKLL